MEIFQMKWVAQMVPNFRVKTESGYQKNQLSAFQTGLHHSETGTLVERTNTNTNAGRFASCGRHPQTMPKAESGQLPPLRLPDTETE
jgi:hypothetical protein